MAANQVFKALADPTRREILRLLGRGEMTAGALADRFDTTKPTMSHHFSVLKDAELVTSRRDGQQLAPDLSRRADPEGYREPPGAAVSHI